MQSTSGELPAPASSAAAPPAAARLVAGWHQAEIWIAVIAFSLVAGLTIYDVVSRQLLAPILNLAGLNPTMLSIRGSQKIAVYALVVGAFCGLGIATAVGAQLVPRVAFSLFPQRWSAQIDRAADAFSFVALLIVAWYGYVFVESSRVAGMLTSGGLDVKAWVFQAALPLGFLSAAVRYGCFALWPALRPARGMVE